MQTNYINRADTTKPDGTPLETKAGKPFKKLELKADSDQYPKKGVVMWSDHPDFQNAAAGQSITCDLIESDSGTPNPKAPGKNFINRSVAMPGQSPQNAPQVQSGVSTDRVEQQLNAIRADLKIIADHLGVVPPTPKVGNTNVDYPEMNESNNGKVESVQLDEEINPEDIPF